MGNWRTVELIGKINDEKERKEMIRYLKVDRKTFESPASEDDIFYLQFGTGLCGINQWVSEDGKINVVGNVYERDCSVEDLEEELKTIAKKFPNLKLILHAGDDYESINCVASFVVKGGAVERRESLVENLREINKDRVIDNLLKTLFES